LNQLPFSVYDFFGYLASGAVVLAGITVGFVGYEPLRDTPSLLIGLILLVAAYITGQIVANLAGDLVERRLVADRLHRPTEILVGAYVPGRIASWLLPGYSTALPSRVQEQITGQAGGRVGEALFFHCHAVMKSDSVVQARLETFITLYGFCRNMLVALLLVAVSLGVGLIIGSADTGPIVSPAWWLVAAVFAAVGMFYRYLKFYRQYALELLTSYAERAAPSR
jgi:hypothetical protein